MTSRSRPDLLDHLAPFTAPVVCGWTTLGVFAAVIAASLWQLAGRG